MSMLEFENVKRAFGGIVAADNVNLEIREGELRCLIGPNGAGKSTLFKLAIGLLAPQSGSIRLEGRDITRTQPFQRVRQGLRMKYQTTRVFANLTVDQNIRIAESRHRSGDNILEWALARFGFDVRRAMPTRNLTYGEQHWLEMCLILGRRPRILLMDEPTAGMTPEETLETGSFLQELNARGLTVVVIEHDMGFVRQIARQVTVLHQGRVMREGPLADIEADPEIQRIYLGEAA